MPCGDFAVMSFRIAGELSLAAAIEAIIDIGGGCKSKIFRVSFFADYSAKVTKLLIVT